MTSRTGKSGQPASKQDNWDSWERTTERGPEQDNRGGTTSNRTALTGELGEENWNRDIVSPGIEPGHIVFPSQNNNSMLCSSGVLQTRVGIGNF
jgi:hypothetical protein